MDVYSLENATRSFFCSDVSRSRKEYDDLARSLPREEPIVPFNIQGQFSYTVFSSQAVTEVRPGRDRSIQPTTNAKIVQFRPNNSKIATYVIQLGKASVKGGCVSAELPGGLPTDSVTAPGIPNHIPPSFPERL